MFNLFSEEYTKFLSTVDVSVTQSVLNIQSFTILSSFLFVKSL